MTSSQTVRLLFIFPRKIQLDFTALEASLAHLDAVSARLAETQQELQNEVDSLQAELKVSQDPERMLTIQEMISVSNS